MTQIVGCEFATQNKIYYMAFNETDRRIHMAHATNRLLIQLEHLPNHTKPSYPALQEKRTKVASCRF